jgi:CMP/dCMP kinase
MVVAIDGPAGAGKGTTSRLLAATLTESTGELWTPLDTGTAYRAVGVLANRLGMDTEALTDEDIARLVYLVGSMLFDQMTGVVVSVGETAVGSLIRTPEAGAWSSKVAVVPSIREAVNAHFREQASTRHIVGDGRDLTTVVFPDAILKIYLTASPNARAERRVADHGGVEAIEDIASQIAERDARDAGRATAPLSVADAAVRVDTSEQSPRQVVAQIVALLMPRIHGTGRDPQVA